MEKEKRQFMEQEQDCDQEKHRERKEKFLINIEFPEVVEKKRG